MTSPSSRRPPRRRSRLADEHPAWPAAVPAAGEEPQPSEPAPAETPAEEPPQLVGQPPERLAAANTPPASAAPMPAPRRRRQTREQLNTRIAADLHQRLHRFVDEHDAAVQDVVETALVEYLERRGH